jgi:hypothetical protein
MRRRQKCGGKVRMAGLKTGHYIDAGRGRHALTGAGYEWHRRVGRHLRIVLSR